MTHDLRQSCLSPLYIFFQTSKKGCTKQSIYSVQLQLQMPTRVHVNKIEVGLGSYLEKEPNPSIPSLLSLSVSLFIYLEPVEYLSVKPARKKEIKEYNH